MSEETTPPSPPPPKIPPPSLPPPLPARPNKNVPQHSLQHSTMSSDDNLYDVENEPDGDDEISQQMTASYSEISFKSGLSPDTDIPLSLGLEQIESMSLRDHVKSRPKTLTCDRPNNTSSNPLGLGPLDLEGTVHVEGNMTHFVAEDLEYKIKLSSPVSKKGDTPPLPGHSRSGTPNTLYRQILAPQFVHIDSILLNELECEAQRLATSIDNLTENLCGILHSVRYTESFLLVNMEVQIITWYKSNMSLRQVSDLLAATFNKGHIPETIRKIYNIIIIELQENQNKISSITADNVDVYKDAVSKMSDAMDANIKSMYTIVAKAEEVTQAMKSVQAHAVQVKEIRRLVDLFESYL